MSSSVKLHRRRTIAGKLLAFGFVAKIVTTLCRLGLLPAAQNFLASIWPLIEILRSLVTVGDAAIIILSALFAAVRSADLCLSLIHI